uniref:Ecdysis triggering hormone n=1 Tax=Sogatella furcifera TaxID=113103 RepID=A0A6G5TZE1_SOGFU|nr:ecdysis triggering hormone [Sogatella furcifera]
MYTAHNRFVTEGVFLILSATFLSVLSLHSEESIDMHSKYNQPGALLATTGEEPSLHTMQRRNDFFLKVNGKTERKIPRVGRRNSVYPEKREELESPFVVNRRNDFFLKAHKSIPRIGRRNSNKESQSSIVEDNQAAYNQRLSKKFDTEGMEKAEASAWPWFRAPGLYVPQKRAIYFTENPAYYGPGVIMWDTEEHPSLLLEESEANFGSLD